MDKYEIDVSSALQDNVILEHYGLNELNFETVSSYRGRFAADKPNHPWNGLETKEFLYKIGAWGKVRNTSKEGLTLAGLLMFSEERVITEVLPQYFLEYRECSDSEQDEWTTRFTSQDGTWSGNVYDFYFRVMAHEREQMDENGSIASSFHEALMNAIVHCDYNGEGGVVIEKNSAAYRFSNPGLLRINHDQAFEATISNLRNPILFKLFGFIHLCKRAGSGLKIISTTYTHNHDTQPELIQDSQMQRTQLELPIVSSQEGQHHRFWKDTLEEIAITDMGNNVDTVDFNQKKTEIYVEQNSVNKSEDSYNNEVYSSNNNNKSYNNQIKSAIDEVNLYNNDENPYKKQNYSYNNEVNSDNKKHNSYNSKGYLEEENKQKDSLKTDIIEDHSSVDEVLWKTAQLAREKKRLKPSMMEDILVRLCEQKPLMLKELADLVARTPDGLRNNYLAKLLDEGRVSLKYPDQPNHPKQAYLVKA
ncbi:ATP-binding protein [Bacillus sp. CGMCC 1.16541]|uniref:ATP-binding protein n=1 Tax=Bacillus sp. CGMCC 1.16541 TaxID=2185143 RepID=UPI000D72C015|nr:ATP-binding protein [Bacillus sp. CGMCC 1.16541]